MIAIGLAALALSMVTAGNAAPVEAGYRDFSYGASTVAPTAKDEQSKVWFNDGIWWGVLYSSTAGEFHIYRLDGVSQTWSDTNVFVDERENTRSDALWDGTKLYVVTAGTSETNSTSNAKIRRYSYSTVTQSYALDSGFPVTITNGGTAAITIDKDTTGTIWAAFTQSSQVWVTHTTTADTAWVAPFVLPATGATGLLSQDEAAIVAYNSKIGIMWGNQNPTPPTDWAYFFAIHTDGAADNVWQSTVAHQAPEEADNHINVKALPAGDPAGQVVAAAKTSLNGALDPLYYLLVLKQDGTWAPYVFGRVSENHTRAQVAIDIEHREVYMFASSPCCNGGTIYYKSTSLDVISFPSGLGTPFIQSSADTHINNPSTTKQLLTGTTGLVALAGDDTSRMYLHQALALPPAAGTTILAFSPEADARVEQQHPGTNYGGATTLVSDTSPNIESYARFTVDGAGTIASAKLRLYVTNGTSNGPAVYTATNSWTETGITWNNKPARTSGIIANLGALGVNAWAEYDVTSVVTANGTYTFDLGPESSDGVTFNSREAAENRPELVVTVQGALPPETTIDSGPSGTVNTSAATFTFSSNDATATFECALDGAAFSACTSPQAYSGLADGAHTFQVRAISSANQADPTPASRTWTVDTIAPETTIDSGPSGTVTTSSATFTFSSNEATATFECALDGAAFSACTSPKTYTALADGAHTFEVRAKDAAGNLDPTPDSRTWTVDTATNTVTASAEADARVEFGNPNTNFGTSTSLISDTSPLSETYLRFTLGGISGTVLSAKLRLFNFNGTVNGPALYTADNNWTETGITWNNKPARTSGIIANLGSVAINTWVEYDVFSVVTANGTYTFNLGPESSDGIFFNSREATSNTPELVVTVQGQP